jgi:double-strand break repair protein MRE11
MFSGKIEEEEKLRPEELNQQNIEALLAESNLVSPYLVHGS